MSENNSVAGIFSGHGQIKTPTYKEQAYRLIKEAILYQRFQADTIYPGARGPAGAAKGELHPVLPG